MAKAARRVVERPTAVDPGYGPHNPWETREHARGRHLAGRWLAHRSALVQILGLLTLLVASAAGGQTGERGRLYEVTVAVPNAGESAREAAFAKAQRRVLTRAVGQSWAIDQAALPDPERWVARFQYRGQAAPEGADPEGSNGGLRLTVEFLEQPVLEAIRRQGQSPWPPPRPALVVWLAQNTPRERTLIGSGEVPPPARKALDAVSESRGVPLILPLLDAEDRRAVRFPDVWGGFDGVLQEASTRYGSRSLVIGRLRGGPDRPWTVRWSLHAFDEQRRWRDEAKDQAEALTDGLERAVTALAEIAGARARRRAAQGQEPTPIEVAGVSTYGDYVTVLRRLRELPGLYGAHPRQWQGDTVVVEVQAGLDPAAIADHLSNASGFLEVSRPRGTPSGYRVRWRP